MSETANATGTGSPEPGKSPFSIWFWLAAALLVAVVVVGVIVGITSANRARSPEPTGSTQASVPPSASDSVCRLEPGDQSVPTTEAPDTEWELVGKIAAPSIEGAGPGSIDDRGFRSCFAHSPMGAVLATANVYVQGSNPELARPSLEYYLEDGPGKTIALDRNAEGGPSDVGGIQIVGFQVLDYSPENAVIEIVFRTSSGALGSMTSNLVWSEGDWRVVIQDNGQPAVPTKQVPSLAGYVAWSGT